MKLVIEIALAILFLISCSNNNSKEQLLNQAASLNIDSVDNSSESIKKPTLPITNRFFTLIQQIDSSGYIFDTARYNQNITKVFIGKYVLFEFHLEQKEQYYWYHQILEDSIFQDTAIKLPIFDIAPFEKAQKIFSYYYKIKDPIIEKNFDNTSEKWYADGFVDEWTFPSQKDAYRALKEMKVAEPTLYFNCGAYFCTVDNYMYVFHTRAARFKVDSKKFFIKFKKENKVIMP